MKTIIFICLMMSPFSLSAQKGEISGITTDTEGNAFPMAKMMLFKNDTVIERKISGVNGTYEFCNLDSGSYQLQVFAFAKDTTIVVGINVGSENKVELDIVLEDRIIPVTYCPVITCCSYYEPYYYDREREVGIKR